MLRDLSTIGTVLPYLAVNRLEGEADHSSISFVDVMSDWGCPALHICLRGMHRGDRTYINVSNSENFLVNLTFVISIFCVRVSIHSNERYKSGAQSFVIEVPVFFTKRHVHFTFALSLVKTCHNIKVEHNYTFPTTEILS